MPIHDYSCPECGEEFEIFVPLKRLDEEIDCPKCGDAQCLSVLKRKLSFARVIKVK